MARIGADGAQDVETALPRLVEARNPRESLERQVAASDQLAIVWAQEARAAVAGCCALGGGWTGADAPAIAFATEDHR